jgi:hypothetical protein
MLPEDSQARAPLRVYSRPGCHLCEQLVDDLLPLIRNRLTLEIVDIDSRPEWQREFASRIPVVEFEGRIICQHFLDRPRINQILGRLDDS